MSASLKDFNMPLQINSSRARNSTNITTNNTYTAFDNENDFWKDCLESSKNKSSQVNNDDCFRSISYKGIYILIIS